MVVTKDFTTKATAEDIAQARELGNKSNPDVFGRFPWDRSEHHGKPLGLSKAGLGNFVYHVLSHGGDITNFFVMWPKVHNSAVFCRVWLTVDAKRRIEESTPYRFDPPPVVGV